MFNKKAYLWSMETNIMKWYKSIQSRKLAKILKEIGFQNDLVDFINKQFSKTIFPWASSEGITVQELTEQLEDSKRQHTVYQTVQISYNGVKAFFAFQGKKYFENKTNGKVKFLKLVDLNSQKDWIKGDEDKVSFDLLFEIDGETVTFELKVTQSTSGWTGATHSTSKSPNYILISIEIEKNKVVVNDEKYVKGIFIMVVSFANSNWKGIASEDSSFTKFSLNSCDDYSENIVCGSLKNKQKKCAVILEKTQL